MVDCGNGAGALVAQGLCSTGSPPTHTSCSVRATERFRIIIPIRQSRRTFATDRLGPERRAELGIAFDGDADRIGLVDEAGTIIWGDQLLIIYARDVLSRNGKGQSIIFDVKCSQALPEEVEKAGGKPVMWKTGHSLIEEKMHETHAPIAGEMSGHMFFAEGGTVSMTRCTGRPPGAVRAGCRAGAGGGRRRLDEVDAIAVTEGPGLIGALLVGLATAKALAFARRLPLIPVDHLHGHVASLYLARSRCIRRSWCCWHRVGTRCWPRWTVTGPACA